MKIISIAAVAKNGAIGIDGKLPWNIPEDSKFFRDSTREQNVLMGRKTMDSLGKPLPKRLNAVLTRDSNYCAPEGVKVFSDLASAVEYFRGIKDGKDLFVIGGAQIYEQAMSVVDEVWLTEIKEIAHGDTFFPFYKEGKFEPSEFELKKSLPQTDLASGNHYQFSFYGRKA